MKKKNGMSVKTLYRIFVYVVLLALAISIFVPVAWVFLASIKENSEFYGSPWTMPKGFYFQNFIDAFEKANMGHTVGDCSAGVLCACKIPFYRKQDSEHSVYGRSLYQCKLHCSANLLNVCRCGYVCQKDGLWRWIFPE